MTICSGINVLTLTDTFSLSVARGGVFFSAFNFKYNIKGNYDDEGDGNQILGRKTERTRHV